ncbi:MAG: DUF3825 domain-containing protein [Pseudorhodoplanes sp.]|uniref:DUF3825 domain-containing protein n=1 Tax=Pseudorhodoplanes sp. TaxID=1934341 RepID=UPI003D124880
MTVRQPEILDEGWYLHRNNRSHGPHGRRIIVELMRNGTLASTDLIWLPGPDVWKSVAEVTNLLAVLGKANGSLAETALHTRETPSTENPHASKLASVAGEEQTGSSATSPNGAGITNQEQTSQSRLASSTAATQGRAASSAVAATLPERTPQAAPDAISDQSVESSVELPTRTDDDYSHRHRNLLQWALIPSSLPHVYDKHQYPNVYDALRSLALREQWSIGKGKADKRWPLLQRYLSHTFDRLRRDAVDKIYYAKKGGVQWAVFNTGLVNKMYDPICMLFSENPAFLRHDAYPPWKLVHICVPSQVMEGKRLDDIFKEIPPAAQYLKDASELIIPPGEEIKFDAKHVIFDAIEDDRYPAQFLEQFTPLDFKWEDYAQFGDRDRKLEFLKRYSNRLCHDEKNAARYRAIINRVRDAIAVASKRTFWNYKTAIPSYYPKFDELSLLLPLCLDDRDENAATVALVVSKRESGVYRAWTVYPLEWAYERARVVCRPDSDWLVPDRIETRGGDDASD